MREVGEPPQFDFEPRDHLDLGVALGVIDMEKAAEASGSRFAYLKGDLVMVEFALVQCALSKLRGNGLDAGGAAGAGARGRAVLDRASSRPTAHRYMRPPTTTSS